MTNWSPARKKYRGAPSEGAKAARGDAERKTKKPRNRGNCNSKSERPAVGVVLVFRKRNKSCAAEMGKGDAECHV